MWVGGQGHAQAALPPGRRLGTWTVQLVASLSL